jgi:hypothetical protein
MRRFKAPKIKLPQLKTSKLKAPRRTPRIKLPKLSAPKLRAPQIKAPKLRAPQIKAPKLRTPKVKLPGVKAPSVKAPQFLGNLYRDMRDRRLLLPAVALAVALIVVPVALSSSPDDSPAPSTAAVKVGSDTEAATSPAVLAEQLGITDYRKRLEEFKSKDPFRSRFASEPTAEPSAAAADDLAADATGTADTATTASTSTSTSATTSTPSSGGSSGSSHAPQPSDPVLLAFRVDVAIGPPGDVTRRKNVELGKFLPGEGKPMVTFAGATEDLKHALFLITDTVSSVTGDGRCVPGRNDCQLLRLAIDDEARLAYAPEGDRTYKLKLLGIGLEPVEDQSADGAGKQDSMSAVAAQG